MIPYYVLIIIPIFFSVFRLKTRSKIVYNRLPIIMFFLFFLALLSFRSINCGADLHIYRNKFENLNISDYNSFFSLLLSFESGYTFFSLLCKSIFDNFQFFLFMCAFVSIIPIMLLYIYESEYDILTISLFLAVAPFTMFFSGLRQSIAMGIGVICYFFCKNNRVIPFVFFVALAYSFHQSAILLLLLYPMTHVKITKKWIIPIIVAFFLCLIYNEKIFGFLIGLSDKYESRYSISQTGSYTYLIMIALFVIFSFIIPNEGNKELVGLRNILILTLFIQCFAPINTVAMRLNYYFLLFIPITIPKIISNSKKEFRQIANLSVIVFTCFFIFWFFRECYVGSDYLQTVPYEAFWEI